MHAVYVFCLDIFEAFIELLLTTFTNIDIEIYTIVLPRYYQLLPYHSNPYHHIYHTVEYCIMQQ